MIFATVLAVACGPSARGSTNDGGGTVGSTCTEGQTSCDGQEMLACVNGKFAAAQACANVCDPTLGCVLCNPYTGVCNGDVSHACNADGQGYSDVTCDSVEGVTCGSSGVCEGACAPASLGLSYIGCEYYPTVTGNLVSNDFDFAVAIANTAATPASITIDSGALTTPMTLTVPPNSVTVQNLPWQMALKLCNETDEAECTGTGAQVAKGAYHLRSNVPVTVYQFNALEYVLASGEDSFTNDASLMLPTNVWNNQYYVAAYPGQDHDGEITLNGEMAVTAAQDGTTVTITTTAATPADGGAPAFTAGTPQMVTLNAGDVLELTSSSGDLTGSLVSSDKPVQVFGGHICANVPDVNTCCCDHLEESMFSVDALGQNYLVNAPTLGDGSLTANVEVVRVIAAAPNTNLTYDPPQAGAPTTIANAGDFITISESSASFLIHADEKILVAQYMNGQGDGPTGDPAETLAVPVEQWRSSYLFHAPLSYDFNFVDISAPVGASVVLDGAQVMFNAIGTSNYAVARESLTSGPNMDGSHSITGDMPFGIQVYGYGQYTAYWYPGGLNLTSVVISDKHPGN